MATTTAETATCTAQTGDCDETKMIDRRTDVESIELTKIAKLYKGLSLEHKKKFFKSLITA